MGALDDSLNMLSQAILQTVIYSDVFDYPLTALEIHRYLTGVKASYPEVLQALKEHPLIRQSGEYFILPGREDLIATRQQREARSHQLLPSAIRYGRILGSLPFVRMVALTGSLAVMNVSADADFDYLLVTQAGRLWTARAFAVTFGRLMRPFRHRICVNLLLAESALHWSQHDLYSARELCQMIPITGLDVYQRLMEANEWAQAFLPNAFPPKPIAKEKQALALQALLELPLRGKLGDRLERWLMTYQLRRIARHWGTGEETAFGANICQSNFHNHRRGTQETFEKKMNALLRQARVRE